MKSLWPGITLSLILTLIATFSPASALAAMVSHPVQKPFYFDAYILDVEARFEHGPASEMISRTSTSNFAIGGRYEASTILLEYGMFSRSSGNSTLSIASNRREYILWWKQELYSVPVGDFFADLGIGGYQEEVRTTLYGNSATDQGSSSAMLGAGAGISNRIFDHIIVSLEARILAGSNFDPNPEPGLLFRSGLEF